VPGAVWHAWGSPICHWRVGKTVAFLVDEPAVKTDPSVWFAISEGVAWQSSSAKGCSDDDGPRREVPPLPGP